MKWGTKGGKILIYPHAGIKINRLGAYSLPTAKWTPASFFFWDIKATRPPFLFLWADSSHFLNSAFLRDTVFSTTYSPEHGKTLLHNFCGITVKHLLHMDIKNFANFLWVTIWPQKEHFVQTCPFKGLMILFKVASDVCTITDILQLPQLMIVDISNKS